MSTEAPRVRILTSSPMRPPLVAAALAPSASGMLASPPDGSASSISGAALAKGARPSAMGDLVKTVFWVAAPLLVVALFVVLFYMASNTHSAVKRLESMRLSNPADSEAVAADATRNCLKAYAVRLDTRVTLDLHGDVGKPVMEETMRVACTSAGGRSSDVRVAPCVYKNSVWLALVLTDSAEQLYSSVLRGTARYAAIAGGFHRLMPLDDMPKEVAQDVRSRLPSGGARHRVLAAAPAYNVSLRQGQQGCSVIEVALPLPANATRLEQTVMGSRNVRELQLHVWAHGWNQA